MPQRKQSTQNIRGIADTTVLLRNSYEYENTCERAFSNDLMNAKYVNPHQNITKKKYHKNQTLHYTYFKILINKCRSVFKTIDIHLDMFLCTQVMIYSLDNNVAMKKRSC